MGEGLAIDATARTVKLPSPLAGEGLGERGDPVGDGCAFAEPPSASVFLGTWLALPRLAAACLARSIENLPVGRKKL